ncbi:uncharacterized protein PAC_05693 [Phialocephala subalpina]|uniref:2EXR domain-containing protein n=1 Tax=Phialocephala subalpina TaxID=576137 RepID=A0A1L7WSR1_9HELO|nr:uncharacterized protein PAC_05693 [Phialocephala subalpina]
MSQQCGTSDSSASTSLSEKPPTTPCSTFTLFPKLPKELRLQVWNNASFITRNVDIWIAVLRVGDPLSQFVNSEHHYFVSSAPPPALLHCCQESRAEGLKHYTLDFGTNKKLNGDRPIKNRSAGVALVVEPRIYINWAADRICLMNYWIVGDPMNHPSGVGDLFVKCKEKKLRFLAFNVILDWDDPDDEFRVPYEDSRDIQLSRPWITGVEELILFPSFEWEGMEFQTREFEDPDHHILTLGETITFSEAFANPDHEGQDTKGKLERCREMVVEMIEQDANESAALETDQEKDQDGDVAVKQINIRVCDLVYQKVKGREHMGG